MLYHDLETSARLYAAQPALISGKTSLTYAELLWRVNNAAVRLASETWLPGARIGLFLHNSFDFAVCLYALSKLGCSVLLLNPLLRGLDVEEKLRMAGAESLITEAGLARTLRERFPKLTDHCEIIIASELWGTGSGGSEEHGSAVRAESRNAATGSILQCSSGTTGSPKMAVRSSANLSEDAHNIISCFGYTDEDRIYCSVPLSHGYGLTMGLIAPIRAGARIIIEKWFMPNRFIGEYERERPTVFLGTPEIFESLQIYGFEKITGFRHTRWMLSSSSSLPERLARQFFEQFGSWPQQVYGMMEVSTISANSKPTADTFDSVGHPVANVDVRIDSPGPGMAGEIMIKSRTVSEFMITAEGDMKPNPRLRDGWFRTGDIGVVDRLGRVTVLNRMIETAKEDLA
ncbi:AMP-dependent synthetase and ligase [Paenibacillus curdlanolyticus YK9]|uniref:AMP-dependent synthetase and ligase n=1 Tax=Paenibacillus curdlanolyticus YK9 TaxID=717606 RepID=E0I7G6_9BACL|nr:AMP-binding protein [Paenibacillus curdlanolyticus]EFM11982.1 AMP-dependent synthetase and ligase [Paenibacillus curdlanolyticus YK9]